MLKYGGIDKDGNVITIKFKEYYYSDLPSNGLVKSFSGVGLNEYVIIEYQSSFIHLHHLIKDEIVRRANELNANIYWRELPPDMVYGIRYLVWFEEINRTLKN